MRTDEEILADLARELDRSVDEEIVGALRRAGVVSPARAVAQGSANHDRDSRFCEGSVSPQPPSRPVEPFERCPKFDDCSCNDCPLDPDAAMHGGSRYGRDGEGHCRARRSTRERIAVACGFPAGWALLPAEARRDALRATRRAALDALAPEVRASRTAGLRRVGGSILTGSTGRTPAAGGSGRPDADRSLGAVSEGSCGVQSGVLRRAA